MKKCIVLLTLMFAFACGGGEQADGDVTIAAPGSEVPTQTTTEVVQLPDTGPGPTAAASPASPGTPVPAAPASPEASPTPSP